MFEINKEFHWSMGHRITRHGGKCYSPHGHEYLCRVYLGSMSLDDKDMVMDFYQLTQIVEPIIEELDHSFMVYMEDRLMKWFFTSVNAATSEPTACTTLQMDCQGEKSSFRDFTDVPKPFKVFWVPWESTAENIAKYICERVSEKASNVTKVEVWETRKCCAVYTATLRPALH
jgi:6-pyruvoyltetrahydropterin/6-carboxytetrahydropterin synthase